MRPSNPSRRDVLRGLAGAAGAFVAAPFLNLRRYGLVAGSSAQYSARCVELVGGSLVIDMLGLLTLNNEVQTRWGPAADNLT
ncbi:MAG: hypothetical protein Q8N53_07515, partial [Longimicrobiales bacterium]|nr:hypothetical protein [Longimicrobiales bacterium]